MQVYKFGGASIKNAEALENVTNILRGKQNIVIVVSAIDKTTNALEKLADAYFNQKENKLILFEEIKSFHVNFANGAIKNPFSVVFTELDNYFSQLNNKIKSIPSSNYDLEYDSIVSYGELLSTCIFSNFLNFKGIKNKY